MKGVKAIETRYNGYRFRSRLEARWAVFFDHMGIEYEYEKEGYDLGDAGWYLPDFWLPLPEWSEDGSRYNGAGFWVEVKGADPTESEKEKIKALSVLTKHSGRILVGPPGRQKMFITHKSGTAKWAPKWIEYDWPKDTETSSLEAFAIDLFCDLGSRFTKQMNFVEGVEQALSARFEHGENGAA